MPGSSPDQLFALASEYVAGRATFDSLFAAAAEDILALPASSAAAELAALVIAIESERASGEYSAAEAFARIARLVESEAPRLSPSR